MTGRGLGQKHWGGCGRGRGGEKGHPLTGSHSRCSHTPDLRSRVDRAQEVTRARARVHAPSGGEERNFTSGSENRPVDPGFLARRFAFGAGPKGPD